MQQRGVRRQLVELVHGRGKVGSVLVEGIEGEFLVKLRCNRSKRQHGALNDAVSESVVWALVCCVSLPRFGWKVKLSLFAPNTARSKRRRRTGRQRHGLVIPGPLSAELGVPMWSSPAEVGGVGRSQWRNFRASRWWIVNVGLTARQVYDHFPLKLSNVSLMTSH